MPGENPDGDRRQLASSGRKPQEVEEKLGTSVQGAWQGGRRPKGVKGVLHRRDRCCFALWVRDVGADGEDGEGPGQFSVQCHKEYHREAAAAREGRELVLPFVGSRNEVYRNGSDMDINPPEAEYGRAIHCGTAD